MEFSIKGWLGVTGGGPIQTKYQNRAFSGDVFHENPASKFKFRSKGAEMFWAPQIL